MIFSSDLTILSIQSFLRCWKRLIQAPDNMIFITMQLTGCNECRIHKIRILENIFTEL